MVRWGLAIRRVRCGESSAQISIKHLRMGTPDSDTTDRSKPAGAIRAESRQSVLGVGWAFAEKATELRALQTLAKHSFTLSTRLLSVRGHLSWLPPYGGPKAASGAPVSIWSVRASLLIGARERYK